MTDYSFIALILAFASALAVAACMLLFSILFGPGKKGKVKGEPFECGMPSASPPSGFMPVNFYLIAALFVMFDIEIAFLYPWAVSFRFMGSYAFWSMLIFISLLGLALLYIIKKGIFSWD